MADVAAENIESIFNKIKENAAEPSTLFIQNLRFISKESLKIFIQFAARYLTTKLKVQFTQFHINDQTYSLYN